jgi:hypothetical protein
VLNKSKLSKPCEQKIPNVTKNPYLERILYTFIWHFCWFYHKICLPSRWFTMSKDIERLHLKFCKLIPCVKTSSSNAGVYGELWIFIYIYTIFIKVSFMQNNIYNISVTNYKTYRHSRDYNHIEQGNNSLTHTKSSSNLHWRVTFLFFAIVESERYRFQRTS